MWKMDTFLVLTEYCDEAQIYFYTWMCMHALQGGVCYQGVSAIQGVCLLPGGCLVWGVSASGPGGVFQHAMGQTPPLWTDRHL